MWGLITIVATALMLPIVLLVDTYWFEYPNKLLNKL